MNSDFIMDEPRKGRSRSSVKTADVSHASSPPRKKITVANNPVVKVKEKSMHNVSNDGMDFRVEGWGKQDEHDSLMVN